MEQETENFENGKEDLNNSKMPFFLSVYQTLQLLDTDEERGRYIMGASGYFFEGKEPDFSDHKVMTACWIGYKPILRKSLNNRRPGNGNAVKDETRNTNRVLKTETRNTNRVLKTETRMHQDKDKDKDMDKEEEMDTPAPAQEDFVSGKRYPQSAEEVLEISREPNCAVIPPWTKEQAEVYLANRARQGWKTANGQQITNVAADIKVWSLNEKQRAHDRGEKSGFEKQQEQKQREKNKAKEDEAFL